MGVAVARDSNIGLTRAQTGMAFDDVPLPTAAGRFVLMLSVAILGGYGYLFALGGVPADPDLRRVVLGAGFLMRFIAYGMTRTVVVVHPRGDAFRRQRVAKDRLGRIGEGLILLGGLSLIVEMMHPDSSLLRYGGFLAAVVLIGAGIDLRSQARDWFMKHSRIVGLG